MLLLKSLNSVVFASVVLFCTTSSAADEPAAEVPESVVDSVIPVVTERWDRVLCIVEQKKEGENTRTDAGSAFIVNEGDAYYLVTASHVAKFTSLSSRLMFRNLEGGGVWVTLGGLRLGEGDPWTYHPQADLAVMPIRIDVPEVKMRENLKAVAHPLDSLADVIPRRATEIEITGFPMMLGLGPELSPLVMVSRVASRESKMDAAWGKESIVFAFPVVTGGTSGGPVYARNEDPAAVTVLGMTIGYQADKAGPQLAKLIPSTVIRQWICEQTQ